MMGFSQVEKQPAQEITISGREAVCRHAGRISARRSVLVGAA